MFGEAVLRLMSTHGDPLRQRLRQPQATIAVRLPTWVGDVVMATPSLRALRRAYPAQRIVLQGGPKLTQLLEGCQVDGNPTFDQAVPAHRGKGAVAKNIATLRSVGADVVVILPHSFRSAWESYRAGVRFRVGYAREGRGWLLSHHLSPHTAHYPRTPQQLSSKRGGRQIFPIPMALQYGELMSVLGAYPDEQGLELSISEPLRESGERTLRELGVSQDALLVVLNPGASFGPSKIWPVASFAAVGDALARSGCQVLITSGPGEEDLARSIAEAMQTPPLTTLDPLLPLAELKVVMQRARVVITSDAGPRHIATAVGTPTVVLMGPTDPRYSHSHLNRCTVLRHPVLCAPCHLQRCPIDHRCMTELGVEDVLAKARQLLA